MDLPSAYAHWLCRDAESHVLGERGMFLFITIRKLWPPHYRPSGEGPFREGKKEHRILSTGGRNVRKDSANAPVRGAVSKSTDQDDRVSRGRGGVAFTEETGSRDGSDGRKVEGDNNAVRKRGRVRELVLKRSRMSGLMPGVY